MLLARTPLLGGHPAVIQLPFGRLVELVGERFEVGSAYQVPIGRWITQFGRRWPTALTPARAYVVVGRKPGAARANRPGMTTARLGGKRAVELVGETLLGGALVHLALILAFPTHTRDETSFRRKKGNRNR